MRGEDQIIGYEKIEVKICSLDKIDEWLNNDEGMAGEQSYYIAEDPPKLVTVLDILDTISDLPLRRQIYFLANLLTVTGYTQKEISEAMGISYKTYRNNLCESRQKLDKDKSRI